MGILNKRKATKVVLGNISNTWYADTYQRNNTLYTTITAINNDPLIRNSRWNNGGAGKRESVTDLQVRDWRARESAKRTWSASWATRLEVRVVEEAHSLSFHEKLNDDENGDHCELWYQTILEGLDTRYACCGLIFGITFQSLSFFLFFHFRDTQEQDPTNGP